MSVAFQLLVTLSAVLFLLFPLVQQVSSLDCAIKHKRNDLYLNAPRPTPFSNRILCTLVKTGYIWDTDRDVVFDAAARTLDLALPTDVVDVTVGITWQTPTYDKYQKGVGPTLQQTEVKLVDHKSGDIVIQVVLPNVTPASTVWWSVSETSRRAFLFYLDGGTTKTVMCVLYKTNVSLWTAAIDGVDSFGTKALVGSYNDDAQLFQFAGDTSKTCNSWFWYRYTNSSVSVLPVGGNTYGTPWYFDNRINQLVTISQDPVDTFRIYNYLTGETVMDYTVPDAQIQKVGREAGPDMRGWIAAVVILSILSFFFCLTTIIAINKIRRLNLRFGRT